MFMCSRIALASAYFWALRASMASFSFLPVLTSIGGASRLPLFSSAAEAESCIATRLNALNATNPTASAIEGRTLLLQLERQYDHDPAAFHRAPVDDLRVVFPSSDRVERGALEEPFRVCVDDFLIRH